MYHCFITILQFPYGFGDPTGRGICTHAPPPTLDKCLEHLIWLEDGRFGKDVAFMYAMKNVSDIKNASSKAAIYVKNNGEEAQKSLDDFRERYKNAPNEKERQFYLATNARAYQRTLTGSPAFWNAEQKKCQAIMDTQEQPFNLFYTVSNAEAYDHVVDVVLSQNLGVPPTKDSTKSSNNQRKRKNANESPLIVARLYQLRLAAFRRFMKNFLGVKEYMDRDEMQELRSMVHTHGVGLVEDCPDFELLLKVLYDHRDESKTPAWFEMKKRVESLIEDWVEELEIVASTTGLKPPQGTYDRSECLTLDIVTIIDDEESTDDCFVKLIHRVQLHKHYPGYCFKQVDVTATIPDNDGRDSRKRPLQVGDNAVAGDDIPVDDNDDVHADEDAHADAYVKLNTDNNNENPGLSQSETNDHKSSPKQKLLQPGEGCRFGVPKPENAKTTVTLTEKGNFVVTEKRDKGYEMMIPTNKEFSLTTQSNHCVVIVLNRNKCSDYIMKYSFKSEKTKKKTDEMLRKLLQTDSLSAMQVTRKMFMEYLGRDQGPCAIAMAAAGMSLTHTSAHFKTLSFESKDVLLTEEGKVSTQSALSLYILRPDGLLNISLHTFVRCYSTKTYEMLPETAWMTPVCYSFQSVYNPRKQTTHEHWCKCICKMHYPYARGVKELLPSHLGEAAATWIEAFEFFLCSQHVPSYVSRGITYYNRKISGRLYQKEDDPLYDKDACMDDEAGNFMDDDEDEDSDSSDDDDDDNNDNAAKRSRLKHGRVESSLFALRDNTSGSKISAGDRDRMLNSLGGKSSRHHKNNTKNEDDDDDDDDDDGGGGGVSYSAGFGGENIGDDIEDDCGDQDAKMQKLVTSVQQRSLEKETREKWGQSILDVAEWEKIVIEFHSTRAQEIGIDSDKVLNESQQKIFDFHHNLLQEKRANDDAPTNGSVSIINGVAGVGKSVLINHISTLYNNFYSAAGDNDIDGLLVVGIIAPTATAATLISGTTIHNFCQCGVGEYQDLEGRELQEFQHKWRNLKILFGDERGMWGKKILAILLRRITQLFPDRQQFIFGGINLILAGDNGQLGPVKDNVIWLRDPQKDLTFKKGKNSTFSTVETCNNKLATEFYAAINNVFFLTKVQRKVDASVFNYMGDEELIQKAVAQEEEFQKLLPDVRNGMISRSAFELLKTRTTALQSSGDLASFRKEAVNIVLSNKVANDRNMEGLARGASLDGSKGYVNVSAVHVGGDAATRKAAARMSGKDCGGIENTIVFVEDSPVLFRRNLCVGAKLVNGSSGKFKAIVRDVSNQAYVDGQIPEAPVLFVIVEFPNYQGPSFSPREGEEKYVPVLFKEGDVLIKKKSPDGTKKLLWDKITRRGLPLMLAYAITVHRCQGMTICRGILDLEKKEFCAGLTFTALSRFASLFHFLIESSCFYESRFEGLRSLHMMFRIAEDARLLMLSEPENDEYRLSWLAAQEVARTSKQSTIKWRIPDGGIKRIQPPAPPPGDLSRSRKRNKGEVNDTQYLKDCDDKRKRKEERREQEAHAKNVADAAIAATLAANRLVIEVPNLPPLGDVHDQYAHKRWCLKDDGKRHMEETKLNIVLHRRQGTDNDTMYQDEYFTNMISYHQMGIFFCTAYIYGSAIDYFLVSSIRYKNIPVDLFCNPVVPIPDLVNDHEFVLTQSHVTYLPTDFYLSLAGDSTHRRANDYDYVKCKDGGYTNQYENSDYLLNDIISVIHR